MGKVIDEILAEHLDAVQLPCHVVEGALKNAEIGFRIEGLLEVHLEIPLGNALGGADHFLKGVQNPLGQNRRRTRADDGTGDEGSRRGGHGVELPQSRKNEVEQGVNTDDKQGRQKHQEKDDENHLHAEGFDLHPPSQPASFFGRFWGFHFRYTAL